MKSLLPLMMLCSSLLQCAAAPASSEPVGEFYFREFLTSCKPDEVRCLWFIDFHPRVAMEMIFDLRARTVASWREVFDLARQDKKSAPLSSVDAEAVASVTKVLKEAELPNDYFHDAFVASYQSEKLVVLRFYREGDRGEFPAGIMKLLKIASDSVKAKEQPNPPPRPTTRLAPRGG